MGASDETGRTIVQVTAKAGMMTMQLILKAMRTASKNHKTTGKQSLRELSSKNVTLDSVPISNVDIKTMTKELEKYGVDFSVVKDRNTGDYTLFFKGTDTVVISEALDKVLSEREQENELDVDKDKVSDRTEEDIEPIDESVRKSKEIADRENAEVAERKAQELSKGTQKLNKAQEQSL